MQFRKIGGAKARAHECSNSVDGTVCALGCLMLMATPEYAMVG